MPKNLDSIGEKPNQYQFSEEEKDFFFNRKNPSDKDKDSKDKGSAFSDFGGELKKLKYLRHVPKVLSHHERLIIKFLVAIILVSSIFLGATFYLNHTKLIAKAGGTYSEGMVGEPKYINPVLADASDIDRSITSFVFRGLMKFDKNLELQPDIAESYEKSQDGKEYTFHLAKNVLWHDSDKQDGMDKLVTADDVVFTIQTIQNKEYNSPIRTNFNGVRVEKVDDFTVKFTLEDTFTPFLVNTTVGILPKHVWEAIPATNIGLAEVNLKPIGNGPYKFKSLEKDKKGVLQTYNLERFGNFAGENPYIDRVSFHFFQTNDLLLDAYKKKDISAVNFLLPEEKDAINAKRAITSIPFKLSLYHAIFFNTNGNKALQDKNVRLALAHAVDKTRIIKEALGGQGIQADGPILPGFIGYNEALIKREFDAAKAESMLHEAGWRDTNNNDTRDKEGQELEFTLRTTDFPEHKKTAEILQEEWKKIGVKLTVETYDSTELQQTFIRPRNYTMLLFGEIVGHDPDPYVYWHSSQVKDPGLNLTSFKNKSADTLLEEARKTDDKQQRILKYLDFQNRVAEEIPAIFLYTPTYLFGVSNDVNGINPTIITNPSERYVDFEHWYIKSNRVWQQ